VSPRDDHGRGRRPGPARDDQPDPEEASGGSIDPSPELEEALREAAAAVPDPSRASQQRASDEVVLDEPVAIRPEDEVVRLRDELATARDRMLRLQADFDNFRKRAMKDREEAVQYGPQILVKDLLSVVDNLARAIDHARQSGGGDLEGLLQGVELVRRELESVLSKNHVREVEALGKVFNPAQHEAMAQVPDASVEPNTIVEVLQKGYQLRDRLIRPARVIVTRAPGEPDVKGEPSGGL
jgi:molecular chaperone GrpE